MVDAERVDQEVVDREPDRAAPVRVAAEERARRLGRLVVERRGDSLDRRARAGASAWHFESARMPWSERNSSSSSIGARRRRSRSWSTIESIRQPPLTGDAMCWTTSCASGRCCMNQSVRAAKSGRRAIVAGPSVVTATSGSSPTTERTRSGIVAPSGEAQHVVVEAVLLVPEALRRSGPRRSGRSARRTSSRRPRTCGRAPRGRARARAGSGSTSPSRPCRRTARGCRDTGSDRAVERADVVEAEEAALEDVVALGVLAVHPPGEVEEQLVEDALEEVEVASSRRSRRRAAPPTRAPAG